MWNLEYQVVLIALVEGCLVVIDKAIVYILRNDSNIKVKQNLEKKKPRN